MSREGDERERPLAVSILAVVFGVVSVPLFLAAVISGASIASLGTTGAFFALLQLLVPEALFVAAIGLWKLRRWGWLAAMAALCILGFLYAEALIQNGINARSSSRALIVIGLLVYLARPSTKRLFR